MSTSTETPSSAMEHKRCSVTLPGEGPSGENLDRPHAQALEHLPGTPMPPVRVQDAAREPVPVAGGERGNPVVECTGGLALVDRLARRTETIGRADMAPKSLHLGAKRLRCSECGRTSRRTYSRDRVVKLRTGWVKFRPFYASRAACERAVSLRAGGRAAEDCVIGALSGAVRPCFGPVPLQVVQIRSSCEWHRVP